MQIKFIIYGAGKRGRELLEVIGKENTIAFVDSDNAKCGTEYCSLPVMSVEDLQLFSDPVMCIVTPVSGRRNIVEELRKRGIRNSIPLKPFDNLLRYVKKSVFDFIFSQCNQYNIAIYGLSAGAIILYEYLSERMEKQVFLVCDKKEEVMDCLCDWGVKAFDFHTVCQDVDVVINTERDLPVEVKETVPETIKIMEMQDLLEKNLTFYNKQIEVFKNIHHGQRCFIVATGPSLRIQDLEVLYEHGEKCISMNRVYNLFEETIWRPDYYVIEDTMMIEDLGREIAEMNLPVKFVASLPAKYWEQKDTGNSIQYQLINLDMIEELPLFSEKIEKCIYEGSTVTYACIQLAAYMGFHEIYLLGVDCNYSRDLYSDINHFAGYQKDKKIRLNTVYPERMLAAYESARQYSEAHGIKIFNATRGGKLEVFERVNFEKLF